MTKTPKTTLVKKKNVPVLDENGDVVRGTPGRKKNPNYLSFAEAREFIRTEMIPSRAKFQEWWDANKPKTIPRFPYRVYQKEWVSWNDFLGNDNEFNSKAGAVWREYSVAVQWAHTLGLKTQQEWMDWCKSEASTRPQDIPARPDLVYKSWRSWSHWLGKTIVDVIQVKQESQKLAVFYIIQERGFPQNIFTFGVEQMGVASLRDRWEHEQFHVTRMYWHDPQYSGHVKSTIDHLSSPYLGDDRTRLTPNVYEIIWRLDMMLEQVIVK